MWDPQHGHANGLDLTRLSWAARQLLAQRLAAVALACLCCNLLEPEVSGQLGWLGGPMQSSAEAHWLLEAQQGLPDWSCLLESAVTQLPLQPAAHVIPDQRMQGLNCKTCGRYLTDAMPVVVDK